MCELHTSGTPFDIYLELGQKKTFAVAVEWPGWSRYGRDEESAIQALFEAGPRYAQVIQPAGLGFIALETPASFNILERVQGNATTDFGAPDGMLSSDWDPIGTQELEYLEVLLNTLWQAFDQAVKSAEVKILRKGPRGGGRDLAGIIEHVVGAEEGYLKRLGWNLDAKYPGDIHQHMRNLRAEIPRGLWAAASGELPREGPRGGKRWPTRFFVRRLAWHVVDHTWEMEDRMVD